MSEDLKTLALRRRIIANALQLKGSHYLLGAAGATPGGSDGVGYRPNGVKLHDNDYNLRHPIIFAAQYGTRICCGRCDRASGDRGDLDRAKDPSYPQSEASQKKWPRAATGFSKVVWGEDCRNKRHFDCIHFINYCLASLGFEVPQNGINGWVNRTTRVPFKDRCVADILTRERRIDEETGQETWGHIAFYTGANTVIHAKIESVGVVEEKFDSSQWVRCGRLSHKYWSQIEQGSFVYSKEDPLGADDWLYWLGDGGSLSR